MFETSALSRPFVKFRGDCRKWVRGREGGQRERECIEEEEKEEGGKEVHRGEKKRKEKRTSSQENGVTGCSKKDNSVVSKTQE